MKSKLPIIVALIFGLIGFFSVQQYLSRFKQETPQEQVLVFARSKAKDERIREDDLEAKSIPAEAARALAGLMNPVQRGRVVGSVVTSDMTAGQPVLISSIAPGPEVVENDKFSDLIGAEERAISLPVDNAGMITGLLVPGDRVDVLANLDEIKEVEQEISTPNEGVMKMKVEKRIPTTMFLLENVKVLAVGARFVTNRPGARLSPSSSNTVTIGVKPREAQILSYAMRNGSGASDGSEVTFTLLLRNGSDGSKVPLREVVVYNDVVNIAKENDQ